MKRVCLGVMVHVREPHLGRWFMVSDCYTCIASDDLRLQKAQELPLPLWLETMSYHRLLHPHRCFKPTSSFTSALGTSFSSSVTRSPFAHRLRTRQRSLSQLIVSLTPSRALFNFDVPTFRTQVKKTSIPASVSRQISSLDVEEWQTRSNSSDEVRM